MVLVPQKPRYSPTALPRRERSRMAALGNRSRAGKFHHMHRPPCGIHGTPRPLHAAHRRPHGRQFSPRYRPQRHRGTLRQFPGLSHQHRTHDSLRETRLPAASARQHQRQFIPLQPPVPAAVRPVRPMQRASPKAPSLSAETTSKATAIYKPSSTAVARDASTAGKMSGSGCPATCSAAPTWS